MKINAIAFVGIPVTDMKRAREFYEGVLGLQPDPEMTGEMWTEYSIGKGTLAIGMHRGSMETVGSRHERGARSGEPGGGDRAFGRAEDSVSQGRLAGLSNGRDPGSGRKQAHHSQTEIGT